MENIFKEAKFGDRYLTRNEKLAIYLWCKRGVHSLIVNDGSRKPYHYDSNGIFYGQTSHQNELDITEKE